MNTAKMKYYKQVKKQIPRLTKNRKELLNMLQYSLDTYSQGHIDSTYFDYINNFGESEEYVNILLEEVDIDDLKKSIRMKNKLLLIAGVTGICAVLLVFVWGIYSALYNSKEIY